MTIWASKSEFETLFGDEWTVELNEKNTYVVFVISPKTDVCIDSRQIDRFISQFKAMGCDEFEISYDTNKFSFRIKFSRNKLLEDYNE